MQVIILSTCDICRSHCNDINKGAVKRGDKIQKMIHRLWKLELRTPEERLYPKPGKPADLDCYLKILNFKIPLLDVNFFSTYVCTR